MKHVNGFWFVALASAVILVSGCLCPLPDGNVTGTESGSTSTTTLIEESCGSDCADGKDPFRISSMLDSGESYFCNYRMPDRRMDLWIKDGEYHAKIMEDRHPTKHILGDGLWVYIWNDGKSNGVKYSSQDLMKAAGKLNASEIAANKTNTVNVEVLWIEYQGNRTGCNQTYVNASLLSPPSYVGFKVIKGELTDELDDV
ncbi:MAG: hypothetical protein NTU61_06060 [Candidatus Altiarchaeota archaeon]|nr:hypothetical protein [Candidatus Altiarchaeota archaeon]